MSNVPLWPKDKEEKLRELWPDMSIGIKEMEVILGYSKGSICSKRMRLGLPPRPNAVSADNHWDRRRARRAASGAGPERRRRRNGRKAHIVPDGVPKAQATPAEVKVTPAEAIAARHPGELRMPERCECHWPINAGRPWLWCCDQVAPARLYCTDHCWLAYPAMRGK